MTSAFWAAFGTTLGFTVLTALGYYLKYRKNDIAIATVLYGLFIFFIVHFVSFENSLGLGIGLLAVLSMVRLRSTAENLVDIGLIFYSITVGLLGASISEIKDLATVNILITGLVFLMILPPVFRRERRKMELTLDEIDLKLLTSHHLLITYLEREYHLNVIDLKIKSINHLKDSATLTITYDQQRDS